MIPHLRCSYTMADSTNRPPKRQKSIVVSPDGKRFGYNAQLSTKGSSFGKLTVVVVIDGWQSSAYETVDLPSFSPDSRHVAFCARKRNRELVVIDGREGPPEEEIRRFAGTMSSSKFLSHRPTLRIYGMSPGVRTNTAWFAMSKM